MLVWHFVSGAKAQLTWTSLDNAASLDSSNIEGSDDNNDVDDVPQIAEVLDECKADTEKAKINHKEAERKIQRAQTQTTSNNTNAKLQDTKKDCIGMGDRTTLHESALKGDVKSIKAALEEGADIEEFSPDGATPLTLAASQGHYDAIKVLLASGANIDGTSRKGWTALMTAVRHRKARSIEELICNGADINLLSPWRWTALLEASYQGLEEIMRILLQYGADPDLCSAHDRTALMHASYKGDEAIVRLLLDAGSSTEATSVHGETAISLAASGGHTNIVQMLLMHGCAPEPAWAKDQKRSSEKSSHKVKAEEIGELEDRMHAPGWTPLMLASQGGYVEIGRMLLERCVNIEARNPDGKTALEIASENGRTDMALVLELADWTLLDTTTL